MFERINSLENWQVAGIMLFIGLAVFWTGLNNPFQGDDYGQIVNNPVVHSLSNFKLFFEGSTFYIGGGANTPLQGFYYRPLMTLTFSVIYSIFGSHALPFHIIQLLLVFAGAFLLYQVLRRLFNVILSLVLALIFLVHPINSQAAFAIPAMQDALFFLFGMLSLWIVMTYESIRSLCLAALFLFLALLAKEIAVVVLCLELLFLGIYDKKRLLKYTGVVALPTLFWLFLKVQAIGWSPSVHAAQIDNLSLFPRLLTAPSIMLFYLEKLIFPWKLASGYYWTQKSFSFSHVLVPLVIDLAVVGLVIYAGRHLKYRLNRNYYYAYWFFAFWAALSMGTILQILPLDLTACDTWFRLVFVGVLAMLGLVIMAYEDYISPRIFIAIAVIVICLLGLRTAVRGTDWNSQTKILTSDISVSKDDWPAYAQLSGILANEGKYKQALPYAQRSISLYPATDNYRNLGYIQLNLGNYDAAIAAYKQGLKYGDDPYIYESLGGIMLLYGSYASDKQFISAGIAKYPHDPTLWMRLAVVEAEYGHRSNAIADITIASHQGPVPSYIYDAIVNNQPFIINFPYVSVKVP